MPTDPPPAAAATGISFRDLALSDAVLAALADVGYESPSPIQAATIPHLLEGRDVLGQAQTGTGKTAAFALPILSNIDLNRSAPQALVLAPTRELAIQVAEAFQRYATHIAGFHVLPIYGGQSYGPQLSSLKRGVHVVVGTPGRLVDHMKRGTLRLDTLRTLVLDEADEMLRMGFIEEVEWILQQTPPERQVALFSATMPSQIRRIAQTYQRDPVEITIKSKTTTANNIRQRYWMVSGTHKLDALTRILEAESFDGMLIFTRTKTATVEMAERLEARGYAVAALNGDMEQKQRERTVARLKDGQLDIVVATDIAARGLDVERISHVLNYDIPTDTESYIHRIGRTGRAGRSGEAILFIAPRERHLLRSIERATRQSIAAMELPTVEAVNDQRISRFMQKITDTLAGGESMPFRALIEQYEREHNVPAVDIAAALAVLAQGDKPLFMGSAAAPAKTGAAAGPARSPAPVHAPVHAPAHAPVHARAPAHRVVAEKSFDEPAGKPVEKAADKVADRVADKVVEKLAEKVADKAADRIIERVADKPAVAAAERPAEKPAKLHVPKPKPSLFADVKPGEFTRQAAEAAPEPPRAKRSRDEEKVPMETFRIEVGSAHGVLPGNIVGAIANEADLDAQLIGRVDIREDHSYVDLPAGMPKKIFKDLQKVWVSGRQLQISRAATVVPKHSKPFGPSGPARPSARPHAGRPHIRPGKPMGKPKRPTR